MTEACVVAIVFAAVVWLKFNALRLTLLLLTALLLLAALHYLTHCHNTYSHTLSLVFGYTIDVISWCFVSILLLGWFLYEE